MTKDYKIFERWRLRPQTSVTALVLQISGYVPDRRTVLRRSVYRVYGARRRVLVPVDNTARFKEMSQWYRVVGNTAALETKALPLDQLTCSQNRYTNDISFSVFSRPVARSPQ